MTTIWLAFQDLKPGERFRWIYGADLHDDSRTSGETYTKQRGLWYTDDTGRRYAGGQYARVKREAP